MSRIRHAVAGAALILIGASVVGCQLGKAVVNAFRPGAPPREELARMKVRADTMWRRLPQSRVLVLPIAQHLSKSHTYDVPAAATLAARLTTEKIAVATASPMTAEFPFEWNTNELAIYWARFKALSAHISASPPAGVDYVLFLDMLGAPRDSGTVGAVHVMVVTARGEMVTGYLWNSGSAMHKQVRPRNAVDAGRMVTLEFASMVGCTTRNDCKH